MELCSSVKNRRAIANFETLEDRFNKVHDNKYSYVKALFKNSQTKIEIICQEHGSFWQVPKSHVSGIGCPECGKSKAKYSLQLSLEEFVEKSIKQHNSFYAYDKVTYTNNSTKIIITCPVHGEFKQIPASHLAGHGCPDCAFHKNKDVRRSNKKEFMTKANLIHEDLYDYTNVAYSHTDRPVSITCQEHGEFLQTPHDHISKKAGCPKCAVYGFKKDKPAILYYLRIVKNGECYYKIGITNNSLKTRFKSDMKYITPIQIINFESGESAYKEEQRILKKYSGNLYKGQPILQYNGNTELFTEDILNLDNRKEIL